jgi:hypothetical protein
MTVGTIARIITQIAPQHPKMLTKISTAEEPAKNEGNNSIRDSKKDQQETHTF